MGEGDARALVRQLLEHEAELPESLRSDILARGPEAVEPLVELLRDESLAYMEAPGSGYAPIHAAELLARLKAPEAIGPMVRLLMRTEPGEILYDTLLFALAKFGPQVAPAVLEALARARNEAECFGLRSALAACGARDERIYAALLAQLQEDPIQGAINLACYGDPRAVEPLKRAFDACDVDEDAEDLFANQAVIELRHSIEHLGGTLDAAQLEKVARARRSNDRLSTRLERALDILPRASKRRGFREGRRPPAG